jgi:hypothetical protein
MGCPSHISGQLQLPIQCLCEFYWTRGPEVKLPSPHPSSKLFHWKHGPVVWKGQFVRAALVGLDGSLAHCFHPLLLNQVQDKSGSIHVAPPQRNRKNDDEGGESGSVDITTEMLYCGTVIGPPAGSDSPMVPVLEWSVNRFV